MTKLPEPCCAQWSKLNTLQLPHYTLQYKSDTLFRMFYRRAVLIHFISRTTRSVKFQLNVKSQQMVRKVNVLFH
uniref:Uncharacterized protein n=1 Tax=Anguilla anguilla TaxID=7936 RepID=A0A0E9WPJ8_ANGAN